jgi:hypothetical protein
MAKFYVDDHTNVSTDEILDKHHGLIDPGRIIGPPSSLPDEELTKMINDINKIRDIPGQKFRVPHGVKNYARLGNVHVGDLFHHIQKGLNTKDLCLLQLITGELHGCLYFDPDDKYYECAENRNCEECISRWMNSDKW